MSRFRRHLKRWWYGRGPGDARRFPYFGTTVHFPRGSFVFQLACDQGIYEYANLQVLRSAARPDTCYFDVGANIGLMSVPLLHEIPRLRVISIEASPTTARYLQQTATGSSHRHRWEVVASAAGAADGETEFFCAAPAQGAFDGFHDTGRAGAMTRQRVPVRSIDSLWLERGSPPVSVIKIDVEGAEALALAGAKACVRATSPLILLEWTAANLPAFGIASDALLTLATELGYTVHAMPALVRTESAAQLRAQMRFEETFILLPRT